MKKYIGVKMISANPMNLGDYNKYRGWQIPEDEDPERKGYLVKYEDGYESWSPETVFDVAYRRIDNMTFGLAIESLKQGKKVCRAGWNGKGMYLILINPYHNNQFSINEKPELCGTMLPYIAMKTADNGLVPWLASQTDILSEDWLIVE